MYSTVHSQHHRSSGALPFCFLRYCFTMLVFPCHQAALHSHSDRDPKWWRQSAGGKKGRRHAEKQLWSDQCCHMTLLWSHFFGFKSTAFGHHFFHSPLKSKKCFMGIWLHATQKLQTHWVGVVVIRAETTEGKLCLKALSFNRSVTRFTKWNDL